MNAASPRDLRLAMLGMIPGNGHPYSWSAIVNGFDRAAMSRCPYAAISAYLERQPAGSVGIPGARVTHLWTDDPTEAPAVAAAALIPEIVGRPEDVLGHVDAVLIATDDGHDHVRRARRFVEAGLPVFVDKPLALNADDLRTFLEWQRCGARILSSSGLRYAPELDPWLSGQATVGDLRWLAGVTTKHWETYGIHALEPLFRLVGPGFASVRLERGPGIEVAHVTHATGVHLTIPVIAEGAATFGTLLLCGTAGRANLRLRDTYTAFRRQLTSFIEMIRTGRAPFPFAETVELMAALIAGIKSRAEDSRRVGLAEITSSLST